VDEVVWIKTNQVRPFKCPKSPIPKLPGSFNALSARVGRDIGSSKCPNISSKIARWVLILTYWHHSSPRLSHTKEHMLVGIKTVHDENGMLRWPKWLNRGLDTDVVVSEVRETSRKPDEVYGIIERMCPGGRKVEIFGRKHNTRPGYAA
jgi:hypothetical protein